MKNPNDGFLRGRIRSLKFAFKGLWILMSTEDSIKAQLFFALIATILGFVFDISEMEWAVQCLAIGLVLVAEAANSAIEEVADFIHPEFHIKIGLIKDIAAGAPTFAALISLIIAGIIYVPKITLLL
ncbi:diacylglycerol kinase [Polaribacter vadi]|jgi:diacylglycerol kinase (ATP)|uniref:Diacylglycerol kinase n=1 Tax=Polaribacter vadi TaxID=1774273 RepID=A0A1B8U0Q7_9FLAO|nr:diacylglycerol kinase family protein [Polaribacter vadi]AOW16261.1 diacylglycerol kinase [Polaribacter vadi]OBY65412.1 diacylglycerol kinase [Polaribacter vadi]|tara:strand:+ start:261 stop:641 length:381 start_codon:yes stop_codon:yes gene_type:complete